ncbi:MAG TPA: hypothetical protein VN838_08105 [Bradyrhizobium sp.]|nr:hypothetical protein [Bradyrhizobium sp.]
MAAGAGAGFHPSRLAAKGRRAPQDDGSVCGGLAKREAWMREAMAAKPAANRRLTGELLEKANDMRKSGVLSKASYDKIVNRLVIPGRENSPTQNDG